MSTHRYTALFLPTTTGATVLQPDPAVITLMAPAVTVVRGTVTLQPDPAVITLTAPAVTILSGQLLQPDPAVITLIAPAVTVLRGPVTLQPDPALITLVAPPVSLFVPQVVQPDPAVLMLVAPEVTVLRGPIAVQPLPAVLRLFATAPSLAIGTAAQLAAPGVVTRVGYVASIASTLGSHDLPVQSASLTLRNQLLWSLQHPGQPLPVASAFFDELAVQVPNAARWIPIILMHVSQPWFLSLRQVITYTSGLVSQSTLASVQGWQWERNTGPERDTMSLRGRAGAQPYPLYRQVTLTSGVRQRYRDHSGRQNLRMAIGKLVEGLSWAAAYPRPGDEVQYGNDPKFLVGSVTYIFGDDRYIHITSFDL
jgi:hypothetical protein